MLIRLGDRYRPRGFPLPISPPMTFNSLNIAFRGERFGPDKRARRGAGRLMNRHRRPHIFFTSWPARDDDRNESGLRAIEKALGHPRYFCDIEYVMAAVPEICFIASPRSCFFESGSDFAAIFLLPGLFGPEPGVGPRTGPGEFESYFGGADEKRRHGS